MRNLLSATVVLLALAAGGCSGIQGPSALTYHDVRVLNENENCRVKVDVLTSPTAVQFRRMPACFVSASNMSEARWDAMDEVTQQGYLVSYKFENPIFELEAGSNTTLSVPHPRYGPERIELTMTCRPASTICHGLHRDSVRLHANRHDSRPFWQDGETRELRCQGIRKARRR